MDPTIEAGAVERIDPVPAPEEREWELTDEDLSRTGLLARVSSASTGGGYGLHRDLN